MNEFLEVLDDNAEIDTKIFNNFEDYIQSNVRYSGGGFGVVHFNIRSLQKHFDELLAYVEMAKNVLDVIVLSETRNIEDINNFLIPNYNIFYNKSFYNKCDGLVIYMRDNISAKAEVVSVNESRFLRVLFSSQMFSNYKKMGLTAYYRSPAMNKQQYIDDLQNYFTKIEKECLEVYVGDINIDLRDKDSNDTINYVNLLNSEGYISYINKPTRVTQTSKTTIDHIFVRSTVDVKKNIDIDPIVFHTDMTDHYTPFIFLKPLSFEISTTHSTTTESTFLDLHKLCQLLSGENWHEVLNNNDSQLTYNIFINKLKKYINESTKRKNINTSKINKIKPWITSGIICSIKNRDRLKKQLIQNYSNNLEKEYKNYRNKLNSLIRTTKNEFYKNKIEGAGKDYKKIWTVINEVTGSVKNTKQIDNTVIVNEQNEHIHNNETKAEVFNQFFTNLGNKMSEQISKTSLSSDFFIPDKNSYSIYLYPITENEIIELISDLKQKCSPGEDKISTKTIKHIHTYIKVPLSHIINTCFTTAKIPHQWKSSIVTPIFKSGDPSLLNNYRPISVINNFAKIFEKALKNRLLNFFKIHNIITDKQYGFMKQSSTEDAVVNLVEKVVRALDESSKCLAVFLDLAKAFDTVSHSLLLEKLEYYGIRGIALDLLRDYLYDRIQSVKVGDAMSPKLTINIGVPQGTVLGPLLFLIYMNNVVKIRNFRSELICYADDTALFVAGRDWNEIKLTAEADLKKLQSWLDNNLLTLNVKKTKFIAFTPTISTQPVLDFCLQIHKSNCNIISCTCPKIDKVYSIRYLGIIIDQHIRWSDHISNIANRLRALMHRFYVLRSILTKKNLMILYNSLVEPILRYCVVVWGGAFNSNLMCLQSIQNTVIKIILHKNRLYSTALLYKETKIFTINLLYALQCIVRIHQNKTKHLTRTAHPTRSTENMNYPIVLFKKTVTQRTFLYFGSKFYNALPLQLKNICKPKNFKIECKRYLHDNSERFLKILNFK
jgi:Reverse transcriptase (RNA-dependent DNA polymerase)